MRKIFVIKLQIWEEYVKLRQSVVSPTKKWQRQLKTRASNHFKSNWLPLDTRRQKCEAKARRLSILFGESILSPNNIKLTYLTNNILIWFNCS